MAEQAIRQAFPETPLRQQLEERIAYLKQHHTDCARALLQRWPTGIPTLKQTDTHTDDQLAAIDAARLRVEADHGIPF